MAGVKVGEVKELWRYPVKSMAGESLQQTRVDQQGFAADRRWALWDEDKGEITNAKKLPKILGLSARFIDDKCVEVEIQLPDGRKICPSPLIRYLLSTK